MRANDLNKSAVTVVERAQNRGGLQTMTRSTVSWLALPLLSALAACSSTPAGPGDGGDAGFSCAVGDASYAVDCNYDPGFTQNAPNAANTISVTFSGETLGISGLPYTPVHTGDPYFVDGWSVTFSEYIVVVDNVRLNLDPLSSSTIWSQMGAPVAVKKGPFVIDSHHIPPGFVGKDGIEPASPLFVWNHLDDGSSFNTGIRYAFSYDIIQAVYPAISVNLPPNELADYDLMVKNHWSKFVRGEATHLPINVQGSYNDPSNPNNTAAMAGFTAMSQDVHFAFGWDDHTQLLNCVNTDNGDMVIDNLANRGVQTNNNGTYVSQITIHVDHLFWDEILHEGTPLRFDAIATWAPQNTTDANPFFINDLSQQKLTTTFSDDAGTPIPDRGPAMTGNGLPPFTTDQPNPKQVIMNTNGYNSFPNNYADFMVFSVQSQSHLNAQGLCWAVGQHSGDPFFVPNVQPVVR
jgi:hypothetical protein